MKLEKSKFKKKKNHQEKVADFLVKLHIKNEELQQKPIDSAVFRLFNKTSKDK